MSKARELIKEMGLIGASDKLQASEDNDCVVRALMHTLGITYAESHHLCETKLNRHPGCGVHTNIYLRRVKQSHGKKINQLDYHINNFKIFGNGERHQEKREERERGDGGQRDREGGRKKKRDGRKREDPNRFLSWVCWQSVWS